MRLSAPFTAVQKPQYANAYTAGRVDFRTEGAAIDAWLPSCVTAKAVGGHMSCTKTASCDHNAARGRAVSKSTTMAQGNGIPLAHLSANATLTDVS